MKKTIYIHKHMYAEFRKEGILPSLSYFVYWSNKFPYKNFKKHTSGLSRTAEYKHINILKRKQLAYEKDGTIFLASYKTINKLYTKGNRRFLTFSSKTYFNRQFKIYTSLNNIKEIKYFFKTLPILSNLYTQRRTKEWKEKYYNIHVGKTKGNISIKQYKSLKRYEKEHNKGNAPTKPDNVRISIKGSALIGNVSHSTSVKYRKLLKDMKLIIPQRKWEVLNFQYNSGIHKELRLQYPYVKVIGGRFILDRCTEFIFPT